MDVFGFIKNEKCDSGAWRSLVIEREKCPDKRFAKMLAQGWELAIDNVFENVEKCYEAMEAGVVNDASVEVKAYQEYCRCCGWYMPVSKVVGRRYDFNRDKFVIFNGRACDQCIQEFETIKYNGRNMTPDQMEREQRREWLAEVNKKGLRA